jgi:hypothetical protein
MEDEKPIHQFNRFGMPGGPSTPNKGRADHLEFLERRRREQGPAKVAAEDGAFGYAALSIPELDYYVLVIRYPELNSKDADEQRKAWQKFCRSDASLPYRVDASVGKRARADGIIIR